MQKINCLSKIQNLYFAGFLNLSEKYAKYDTLLSGLLTSM